MAEFSYTVLTQIREIIEHLQSPIKSLPTVLHLLAAPLDCIGLLPPQFRRHNVSPLQGGFSIPRHIPPLQRALLEHIIPAWEPALVEENCFSLVEQYFSPDAFSFASVSAGEVAIHAYSTLSSLPLTEHSIRLLSRLTKSYPIDVLHSVLFNGPKSFERKEVLWEDCVRDVSAIPARVANALGGKEYPSELEYGHYFNAMSVRCEILLSSLSLRHSRDDISSLSYLFTKLVNIGIFAPSSVTTPKQPSFFATVLPMIRFRLAATSLESSAYSNIWSQLLSSFSSSLTLRAILNSLFSSLEVISSGLDTSLQARGMVKREAKLLSSLVGTLSKDRGELWDSVSAVVLGKEWDEGHARIFACWAAGAETGKTDTEALRGLLTRVVDIWTDVDHIKHSLLSRHHYMTCLFLVTMSSFQPSTPDIPLPANELALSPSFISSISTYIGHLDQSVRRCGMLAAEEVAHAAGKKLDFGDWDSPQEGMVWCRNLRQLLKERDTDADFVIEPETADLEIVNINTSNITSMTDSVVEELEPTTFTTSGCDSDDSLTGYASPSSSRSVSPTPSELDEIEKDPTLRVGVKKIPRPVYLAQLGEMVRPTSSLKGGEAEQEARTLEVALDVAEELIRRKKDYGTELEENTVNLVYGFIGLQNNFELEGFVQKRQAALNALVACCPRKAAPTIIEQFFNNQYSMDQRYAMLNALALGARELASLQLSPSVVIEPIAAERISFPSRRLPESLHRKYLTAEDQSVSNIQVQNLLAGISQQAIEKGKDATADKVPEYVRERSLRVRKPPKITEVIPGASRLPSQVIVKQSTTFMDVAVEYFICPLINRFWLFLRDEKTREARTAHQSALYRYRGAGTGLILNAAILSHFLATLAVLVHAARNAKEWLAVIAPDALQLAVTLGTQPLSLSEEENGVDDQSNAGEPKGRGKEAAVLIAALELALVVLDGSLDLDGGRSLGLEHTASVLGAGEWAGNVFQKLEKGEKVLGGGGAQEIRLSRAAAGVLLKVDELTSRWKRSMIDVV